MQTGIAGSVRRAERMARRGQVVQATQALERIIEIYPDNKRARLALCRMRGETPRPTRTVAPSPGTLTVSRGLPAGQAKMALIGTEQTNPQLDGAYQDQTAYVGLQPSDLTELQAALARGDHETALAQVQSLILKDVQLPALYVFQGICQAALGHPDAAIESYALALRIDPRCTDAAYNLGNVLRGLGRLQDATVAYTTALQVEPTRADALTNLGMTLCDLEREEQAIDILRLAAQQDRQDINSLHVMINAQLEIGDPRGAYETSKQALKRAPANPRLHLAAAEAARQAHYNDAAEKHLKRLTKTSGAQIEAWNNLGAFYRALGRKTDAQAAYEKALDLQPDHSASWLNLANISTFVPETPAVKRLDALLDRDDLPPTDEARLRFARFKICDDQGDRIRAMQHLHQANALRRSELPPNFDKEAATLAHIQKLCAELDGPPARSDTHGDLRPVFVLGMPRSGTTLTERILASHSQVTAGGELDLLSRATVTSEILTKGVSRDTLGTLRSNYLSAVARRFPSAQIVTDKLPANHRLTGLILAAIPEARVVHLQRDPRAVCWSIYRLYFSQLSELLAYAYNMKDLAEAHHQYRLNMTHWSNWAAGDVLDFSYEDLVRSQETQSRRLLDHCGLDWEPGCLDFHTNTGPVHTASSGQVRRALYAGSSDVWRTYAEHIDPLLQALATNGCVAWHRSKTTCADAE